jgi:hypothetical protein
VTQGGLTTCGWGPQAHDAASSAWYEHYAFSSVENARGSVLSLRDPPILDELPCVLPGQSHLDLFSELSHSLTTSRFRASRE